MTSSVSSHGDTQRDLGGELDVDAPVDPRPHPLRVLFVCTANVCRSPMAAGMLKLHAAEKVVPISVASAGLLDDGRPVDDNVADIMEDRGVEMRNKRSRVITDQLISGSDLVFGMTSSHVRQIVGRFPLMQQRVHALRRFVQHPVIRAENQTVDDWLREHEEGNLHNYANDDEVLDIPDPIGLSRGVFDELASELDSCTSWIIRMANLPTLNPGD